MNAIKISLLVNAKSIMLQFWETQKRKNDFKNTLGGYSEKRS